MRQRVDPIDAVCFLALLGVTALGLTWMWLDQRIASNINDLPHRTLATAAQLPQRTPPGGGGDLPLTTPTLGVGGPTWSAAKFQTITPPGVGLRGTIDAHQNRPAQHRALRPHRLRLDDASDSHRARHPRCSCRDVDSNGDPRLPH